MKKLFSWILALALVLTIMPMLGVHNHAHAAYIYGACKCGSCSGWEPGATMFGKTVCAKCACTEQSHVTSCDHEGAEYYTNYSDKWNTHERYCRAALCPETKKYVIEEHIWVGGRCVCGATPHACTVEDLKVDVGSIVNPTCNSYASYTGVCEECGATKTITGTEYDYTKHDWVDGVCQNGCGTKHEHTEWADGKCIVCGHTHAEAEHEFTSLGTVPGTCVEKAYTEYECACGATKKVEGEIDPENHKWLSNGMCGNTGCDAACDHEWTSGVCDKCTMPCEHKETHIETETAATCKKEGIGSTVCDECEEIIGTVALEIDEDAHDWTVFGFGAGYCNLCGAISTDDSLFEDETEEPEEPVLPEDVCEEHQWASLSFGAWYCTKCGVTATDIKPLEPELCDHADTYIEVVTAATCKAEGSAKEICDICEEVLDENVVLPIDPDAHDWIVFGFGAGYCKLCQYISTDDSLFEEPEDPMDTCEHDWVQVGPGWYCWKCDGVTLDEPAEPEVPEEEEVCEEHQWASLAFGAWYCTKCGATATDINPLDPEKCDHADTYIEVIDAATCVAEGLGNKICDICETVLEEGVVLPIDKENGHKYIEDEDGNEYCERCEEPNTEVPAEPCEHEWLKVATGWFCGKCGEVTLEDPNAVIPGDINMDGVVDGRDEVRLMKYLVGQNVEINLEAADVNGDGTIDGRDEVRLMKILVG